MTMMFFMLKISLVFIKIWYFRGIAPMETKSPELIKIIFLALKKRPEEALFRA
jgi:hypothetical protein